MVALTTVGILSLAGCGGSSGTASISDPANGSETSAALSWTSNPEPDVAGYRIYFGNEPRRYQQIRGEGLNAGRLTTFTVTGLQRGLTYYFAVTAYDTAMNESEYSHEVSKILR